MLDVKLIGVDECVQKLHAVRRSVGNRIIRKGVKSAILVASSRGRADVPSGETRKLKQSLGWKLLKKKSGRPNAAGVVGHRSKVYQFKGRRVNPALYAHLVDQGTKPHVIAPKNKPRLAFRKGGRLFVVSGVKHPGSRPKPYMRKIQTSNIYGMSRAFRETVGRELLSEARKARPSEVPDG